MPTYLLGNLPTLPHTHTVTLAILATKASKMDILTTLELASFPTQVWVAGKLHIFDIWRGEHLPDRLLAIDCETELIVDNAIPRLALVSVYGSQCSGYFIHPDDIGHFIRRHPQAFYTAHNSTFDFWVIAKHLHREPTALAAWWDVAGDSRLCCTMLLDMLLGIARSDAEPIARDLGKVAWDYCRLEINKADPYRLRYGELIGLSIGDWSGTEAGFWTYAATDVIATLAVMQEQARQASALLEPHHAELLPDTLRRFGPLTAALQVQGSISLDYLSRMGVCVDTEHAGQLQHDINRVMRQRMTELEELAGQELFRRYAPKSKQAGRLMITGAGVPRKSAKLIKERLEAIAKQLDYAIRPPRNKDTLVTDSVKYWQQHRDAHPFIACYCDFSEQAKLLQFFSSLDQQQIFPRYRPLVRTGRTSCSKPNLQQLPRDDRFRRLIIAPPGYLLLQIDYSVLELRTLAQVCLRRFGWSMLAELFRDAVDPHKYTAALLMGIDLPTFEQLPAERRKLARQRAKAINFGVPGGLGAASLVSYAKSSYGVELSIEQARDFRKRLVEQIYPELRLYLADDQQADIASNLQTTPEAVRQHFGRREQFTIAQRIISGWEEAPSGDEYAPELIDYVWARLGELNRNEQLRPDIEARQPSTELMRRIFWGPAVTPSGRIRGHISFSQRANTPFSGLAADGAKLALFRLLRAGYRAIGFIHDEALILIREGGPYDAPIAHIQQILADSMREVVPDVPIETEFLLGDRWYKDSPQQPRDSAGRIVPYRGEQLEPRPVHSFALIPGEFEQHERDMRSQA